MTLSDGIRKQKQYLQNGGMSLGSVVNSSIYGGLNAVGAYGSGFQIGQGLGYTKESSQTLGQLGLINSLLNTGASNIQNMRQVSEERENRNKREEDQYMQLPRDRYAYDDFSNSPYEQNYYQNGGKKIKKDTYKNWVSSLPINLQKPTSDYNLYSAWEGGLEPEFVNGEWHLGSRNPISGQLLKSPQHPTYGKMIEGEIKAGYTPSIDLMTGKLKSFNNRGLSQSAGSLLQQIRDTNPQYKHGGKTTSKRGYWTEEHKYTHGSYHPANIYDSSTSVVRNKKIGKSKQGYSSAVGSHVLGSRHASYKKKGKKSTPVYKPTKQLDSVYNSYNKGGLINNTGYTPNTPSYNNPYNIIPGNHITSKPMSPNDTIIAQPIYDNRFGEPFMYRKGDPDVKDPLAKSFLEIKL